MSWLGNEFGVPSLDKGNIVLDRTITKINLIGDSKEDSTCLVRLMSLYLLEVKFVPHLRHVYLVVFPVLHSLCL